MIELNNPCLPPKFKAPPQRINIVYNCEGLGGYVQFTTAMQYLYEANPHLYGTVFCNEFFVDLAKLWFAHLKPRVDVRSYSRVEHKDFHAVFGERHIIPVQFDLHNALGANYLRLGFEYYMNIDYIPEGYDRLPAIVGNETDISKFNLPKTYAVVTTEATTPSRMLKSSAINGQVDYLKKHGITPVFLGKKNISRTGHQTLDYSSQSPDGISVDGVIDLREKTGLLEAACILARAQVVTGLDNGLLHLAACSKAPIVWAFNTVHPAHRVPPREGKMIALGPPESLPCRFCQSRVELRYVDVNHDFRECLLAKFKKSWNFKCIETLTAAGFIGGIQEILDL